jgi:DNA-binding transcriptional LysR family regulator
VAKAVPDPNLSQLRALRRLSEAGSYEAAAGREWTRQALWQQIHRLELYVNRHAAGTRVIRIAPEGRLSDEGRLLLAAGEQALEAVDAVRTVVRDLGRGHPVVRLGCFPAHALIATLASEELRQSGSPVSLQLDAMSDDLRRDRGRELIRWLRDDLADVVIGDSGLQNVIARFLVAAEPLYSWQLIAVVGPNSDLRGSSTVELSNLSAHRLMASPRGHASRELVEETASTIRIDFESESVDALFTLARADWGVALLPNDALPVSQTAESVRRQWPRVTVNGSPIGGQYSAMYAAHARPRSAARRTALALARAAQTASP